MIFLCYRRYSWQFDSFGIAKSHIHNNGFCGFNSWQVEQEPVSLVHPWFTLFRLYIFRFLHQTTTIRYLNLMMKSCISFVSYIKPQRFCTCTRRPARCISFVSYIKPQLYVSIIFVELVVYLSFPTSNHNGLANQGFPSRLYIFRFLHQTTTHENHTLKNDGCISFVSYIKPQPSIALRRLTIVVYLSFPTSNHNLWPTNTAHWQVVYLSFPTSNHN